MKPRFRQDYRSLFWSLLLFPLVPAIGYARPSLAVWLLPFNLYLAYCAGVLTHNHVHCPVFVRRTANVAYSAWLTVFYGCPIFTWVPTHTQNHHRFLDGPEDVTRTTRRGSRNTLLHALSYPFWSAWWQTALVSRYVKDARVTRSRRLREIRLQYLSLLGAHTLLLTLAVLLQGPAVGLGIYVLGYGLPAASATWWMMFTNYVQHVECDTGSQHNHSRNFVSPFWNWFVFDAGYHTVHHEHPGVHWSRYAELHRARSAQIDPTLNQRSIFQYCLARYVLGRGARDTTVTA